MCDSRQYRRGGSQAADGRTPVNLLVMSVVHVIESQRRHMADWFEDAPRDESHDPFERPELDVLDTALRSALTFQFTPVP